jgi:hypothetical protein
LTAQGIKDGKVIQTVEVHTTGPAVKLELTVDRSQIRTSHSDVAHVTVRVLDSENRMVPTAGDQIAFTVSGAKDASLGSTTAVPTASSFTTPAATRHSTAWLLFYCSQTDGRAK